MAERKQLWLPESYQNFSKVSQQFDKNSWLRIGICAGAVGILIFLTPSQSRNISLDFLIGGGLGLLTEPSFPHTLNRSGRRLYLDRYLLAKDISEKEGWSIKDVSYDQVIKRAKTTLSLTNQLAPVQNNFKRLKTPLQRTNDFNTILRNTDFRSEANPDNMLLSVARKALNFAEIYWESNESIEAKEMIDAIKGRRAVLSREAHMGYSSKNMHWH